MQESGYRVGTIHSNCGIKSPALYYVEMCVWQDFGISQINYKTAKQYKMSLWLLLTNVEFSIDAGAKVLSWFKRRYAHKEEFWYVRYNCGTRSSIDRPTCNAYKKLVKRWM